jgi:hypothetical protein
MAERAWKPLADAALRIAAALVGTLPAAVLAAVCLARFLPLGEATRFTLGFMLAIPLWVAAICSGFIRPIKRPGHRDSSAKSSAVLYVRP